jgi:hypothetical protein
MMKFTITGRKKLTMSIEGKTPNEALCRFAGVTSGAMPEIINGMDVLGKCGHCGMWITGGDGEYYGDDHELLCVQCYWKAVEKLPEATDERPDPPECVECGGVLSPLDCDNGAQTCRWCRLEQHVEDSEGE